MCYGLKVMLCRYNFIGTVNLQSTCVTDKHVVFSVDDVTGCVDSVNMRSMRVTDSHVMLQ
jgi:hypothetical protein